MVYFISWQRISLCQVGKCWYRPENLYHFICWSTSSITVGKGTLYCGPVTRAALFEWSGYTCTITCIGILARIMFFFLLILLPPHCFIYAYYRVCCNQICQYTERIKSMHKTPLNLHVQFWTWRYFFFKAMSIERNGWGNRSPDPPHPPTGTSCEGTHQQYPGGVSVSSWWRDASWEGSES